MKPLVSCGISLLSTAIVASAIGCTHTGASKVELDQLPELVVQPADLESEYERFDEGRQVLADAPPGAREDPERFGRQGGWKARYRRSGSPMTQGPLVVESRADLFADASGAERDLEAYEAELRVGGDFVDPPRIGEAAVAATRRQQAFPRGIRFYIVAWREANVTASVLVQGFEGRVTLDDALELARKMQRRIEQAAEAG